MYRSTQIKLILSSVSLIVASIIVVTAWCIRHTFITGDIYFYAKLSEVEKCIDDNFYFAADKDKLHSGAVEGLVNSLDDDYSFYFEGEGSEAQMNNLNGVEVGVGLICLNMPKGDGLYVYRAFKDGSAYKKGVREKDIITKVNGKSVASLGIEKSYKTISGKEGTSVLLTLNRGRKEYSVKVKRATSKVQSVYYKKPKKDIGIITIDSVDAETDNQFKEAIEYYKEKHIKGLVIDLRHNSGGTVDSAAEILDMLLPKCDTVVVKYAKRGKSVRNRSDKKYYDVPLVVLTDEGTASASEIICADVQDFKRGILMGSRTYGKSIVQRTFSLSDGSLVKFTVGEFIRQNGVSYHKKGIEPDVKADSGFNSEYDFYFRTDKTDAVLNKAIKYLKTGGK